MSEIIIRDATVADLEALSALSRRTFHETFVEGFGIPYPPEDLETYFADAFSPEALAQRIEANDCVFWVAERDGQLLALCHAGQNDLPHPDARDGEMELRRLYVAREAQGLGLGRELLGRALEWMQAATTGALWIGVWSGNLKAQKLYGLHGFKKVGDYQYRVGHWMDDEFILRRT